MEKLKSTLPNMLLSLTITCVVAGAILASVNDMTAGAIAASKAAALETAIKEVVPEFNNKPVEEAYMSAASTGDSLRIYPAKMDGELVGAAVESFSNSGFSGEIRVIVGFNTEGKITNYSVLQHSETPGLGSKMQEWFRTDRNKQSIIGRSVGDGLKVSKDGGDVDAITAATISSRAFLDAVNRAYSAFAQVDAAGGATSSHQTEGGKRCHIVKLKSIRTGANISASRMSRTRVRGTAVLAMRKSLKLKSRLSIQKSASTKNCPMLLRSQWNKIPITSMKKARRLP